jgi:hypothetical protein
VSQLQQQHLQQQQQAGETAGGLRLCIRLAQIPPHERRQIGWYKL